MNLYTICILTTALLITSCGTSKKTASMPINPNNNPTTTITPAVMPTPQGIKDPLLQEILFKDPFVKNILENPATYQAQILYTKIDRTADNTPTYTNYSYHADANFYFYPASMVKMPIAFLALQKIKELNNKGIAITKDMTMLTIADDPSQTNVYNDPTAQDGRPTIAQYIKKIFLVSDNDAYNRLYEFLGQEYINTTLHKMGYKNTEILHRLSLPLSVALNKKTNIIKFVDTNGTTIYTQAAQENKKKYSKRIDLRGMGYIKAGEVVNEPFDFSAKNKFPLQDMHDILSAVVLPSSVYRKNNFNITPEDVQFLRQYMCMLPRQSNFPNYPSPEYYDDYVKFNLYGSTKQVIPNNIRIFNKVGDAYGYYTDAAYIVDFNTNTEFLLSITIYANQDQIFNDDVYQMQTIAMPFMKKCGELIYNYETKRPKKIKPILEEYKLNE